MKVQLVGCGAKERFMFTREIVKTTDTEELEAAVTKGHSGWRLVAVIPWGGGINYLVFEKNNTEGFI